jgi:membrane-bound metal-dependent hydrolase YbcI (DUF457 family)
MSPTGHTITAIAAAAALSVISGSGIGEMAGQAPVLLKALAENTRYFVCSADQAAALACLGILVGGRLPDRLEIPAWNRVLNTRESLIPHRTLTHWPALWLAVAAFIAYAIHDRPFTQAAQVIGLWFAAGACGASFLHLAMDIMTPTGIPLLFPFGKRTTLNIYRSGSPGEMVVVLVFCAALYVFTPAARQFF